MIREVDIVRGIRASDLVSQLKDSAFNARRLGEAAEIYREMVDSNAFIFFTLAGAMVPAGMRGIVRGILDNGFANVLVTTGANVTHEIAEALGFHHKRGSEEVDDVELSRQNVNRIYDVFIENSAFEGVEEFVSEIFQSMDGEFTSYEILWEIGSHLPESSFLRVAYEKEIPVFCPTLHDSILGLHLYIYGRKIRYNPIKDVERMVDLCFQDKSMGVVIVGGGVPKNFTLQSMLLANGFDYAIQITTDSPQWGGLSGATLDEAKSWCKLKEGAKAVTVYSDATIALPLIYAYLLDTSG
ncbi:MAG: deoxyhypusine synthase [Archaeoglobi archaeon]|nr:deoxyhypusine synthase [Archaeoglobi archaeon]